MRGGPGHFYGAEMDDRRKMLKVRAWRRGFRELDLILGRFADHCLADLSATHVDEFERLLGAPDQDVYAWLTAAAPVPPDFDTPFFADIRRFMQTETARP
jgi:antitoxin CptB